MKCLLLSVVLFVILSSCGNSGSSTAPFVPEAVPAKSNILKINTGIYGKYNETAVNLISISVSNSTAGFTDYTLKALTNGIKIPTNTTISIKIQTPAKEDYLNDTLWTGYSFNDPLLTRNKEIEIVMDRNVSLSLITTENSKTPLDIATLFLTVVSPESIPDVGVQWNDLFYGMGTHELIFAKGQEITLNAIKTTNKQVMFLGFQTTTGIDMNTNVTVKLEGETTIQAEFLDKAIANITASVSGVKPDEGAIYVNGVKIEQSTNSAVKLTNTLVTNQIIGQKITLKAEPVHGYRFVSWGDSLSGYLSDAEEYEYVVSADTVITPVFSKTIGVVTVSISPRTNYFTLTKMHVQNLVQYTVYSDKGELIQASGGTNEKKHLSWENNTITELGPGYKVVFKAIPGEGFYNGDNKNYLPDPNKVVWSGGSVSGVGYDKELIIDDKSTSQGLNVSFTIEKREVTVKLENYKQVDPVAVDYSADNWVKEELIREDAKGYTIYINGIAFKDVKTVTKIFDWHTKVDVQVDGGKNYSASNSIKQSSVDTNPEEKYNIENPTNILSFDLEKNNTTTAKINHKQVIMSLQIVGGEFGDEIPPDYDGFIKVIGSGYPSIDGESYKSGKYYNGTDSDISSSEPEQWELPVLSEVPLTLIADSKANIFERYTGIFVPSGSTTDTNVLIKNSGVAFDVTSRFYAPIWNLTVNMRGNIVDKNGNLIAEDNIYKAANYFYNIEPVGKPASKIEELDKIYRVTNGIPVKITAESGSPHYTFHSISGIDKNIATRDVISTNNANVKINFVHTKRNMKINITGGRDDRNQSYVKVSGTGIPENDRIYYASNRNTLIDSDPIAPVVYDFDVLSGIKNVLKLEAVTSMVHNFDCMKAASGILNGEHKRGIDTYSTTNLSTVSEVPANDTTEVNVAFRINSYKGRLNGTRDGEFQKESVLPVADSTATYKVYTASQLKYLFEQTGKNFSTETIKLMNDIYFANDDTFNGFKEEFSGSFLGNGFIIFDLAIKERALFHTINSAQIVSLVTGRGYISGNDVDNVGLIGTSVKSSLKYITNASRIGEYTTKKINTGGVVGNLQGRNMVSYIGNYGKVEGMQNVGGVVGRLEYAYYDNKYMFNRGIVRGWEHVGGVVGRMDAVNKVHEVFNTGNVEGVNHVGGIVGVMGWAKGDNNFYGDCNIENFYNTGNVFGGSGVAGTILGCRRTISGGHDKSMTTEALTSGYSIGDYDVDRGASIVTYAGYKCDWNVMPTYPDEGEHNINILDTYVFSKTPDLRDTVRAGVPVGTIDYRINDGGTSGGEPSRSSVFVRVTGTYKDWANFVNPNGDNGFRALNTLLPGLDNGAIWVQTQRLPSINGFTIRPTFRTMPEENIPKYMYEYDKYDY